MKIIIILWTMFVLMSNSFSGGRELGNGGDFIRSTFFQIGEQIIFYLATDPMGKKLVEENGLSLKAMKSLLNTNVVKITNDVLIDNTGSVVDGIAKRDSIKLYEKNWHKYIIAGINLEKLIFHEMLRAIGKNDDDYIISKEIVKLHPEDINFKSLIFEIAFTDEAYLRSSPRSPGGLVIYKGDLVKLIDRKIECSRYNTATVHVEIIESNNLGAVSKEGYVDTDNTTIRHKDVENPRNCDWLHYLAGPGPYEINLEYKPGYLITDTTFDISGDSESPIVTNDPYMSTYLQKGTQIGLVSNRARCHPNWGYAMAKVQIISVPQKKNKKEQPIGHIGWILTMNTSYDQLDFDNPEECRNWKRKDIKHRMNLLPHGAFMINFRSNAYLKETTLKPLGQELQRGDFIKLLENKIYCSKFGTALVHAEVIDSENKDLIGMRGYIDTDNTTVKKEDIQNPEDCIWLNYRKNIDFL